MKRDVNKLMELYKGKFGLVGITPDKSPEEIYGKEGEYFVRDDGNMGQSYDTSVIEVNTPPGQISWNEDSSFERYEKNQKRAEEGLCQPGLWCQWVIETPTNDEQVLCWDGGEKFYSYVEWLKYLITHFFSKWGVLLNGEISWSGEESSDLGKIVVTNNEVKVLDGKIIYQ